MCGKNGCVLFLPVTSALNGHYVSMFMRGNTLYYTDSYGFDVRTDISKASYILRQKEQTFLSRLLIKFMDKGGNLEMNPYGYQKLSQNSSTCGRYAVIRLYFQSMDHEQFHKFLQFGHCTPDELVTIMTWKE